MQKYIANFIDRISLRSVGATENSWVLRKVVVYAYNLDQAFREASIYENKHGLELNTIIDCEEDVSIIDAIFVEKPPYYGLDKDSKDNI